MKRLAAVLAVVAVSACSGQNGQPVTDAVCSDLRAGLTPMQLWNSDARGGRDGSEFQSFLRRHAELGCPEQVERYADYFNS